MECIWCIAQAKEHAIPFIQPGHAEVGLRVVRFKERNLILLTDQSRKLVENFIARFSVELLIVELHTRAYATGLFPDKYDGGGI